MKDKPVLFLSLRYLQDEMPEALKNGIAKFQCRRDKELENFLRERAFLFEETGKSRTYFLLDEYPLCHGEVRILAYCAVAPQVMFVPPSMPVRQIQRLDGLSGKIHGRKVGALPVYLIGQLAKNDDYANETTGHDVLLYVWEVFRQVHQAIGGRIVMVDVKSSADGLIRFYENEHFRFISSNEETGLSQLIYMLND